MHQLKFIADKNTPTIKQLIKFTRDVILDKKIVTSENGIFTVFHSLYKTVPQPFKYKNISSRIDEKTLRDIYQDRILYELFGRVLQLHAHVDKMQILESGLGLIVLKYSQTKGLSKYRQNLFNDMAFQNIWEQMYELKRILTYRNLETLQAIETDIQDLIAISRLRKKSSLKSSHIVGAGEEVLIQTSYYQKQANENQQSAKVPVKKQARVSKADASRQAHHKMTSTLQDIEKNQQFLKQLTHLALRLKEIEGSGNRALIKLHLTQILEHYLKNKSVSLLVGEDISIQTATGLHNAHQEIYNKYLATESVKTAVQKSILAIEQEDLRKAYQMIVKACYAVAFRIYEIHRIHGYDFLRSQLYFKNRYFERQLNHLYDQTLPDLAQKIIHPLKARDTGSYMLITKHIKEVIDLCFTYERSENLKPMHEQAAKELQRIINGLWFLYNAQKFQNGLSVLFKEIDQFPLNGTTLKNAFSKNPVLFSKALIQAQLQNAQQLSKSPNLIKNTQLRLHRIIEILEDLNQNKIWSNAVAMRALGDSFDLEHFQSYVLESYQKLGQLIKVTLKNKPILY